MSSAYRLDPEDTEFSFGEANERRPWKKVALAVGLLLVGTVLLAVGLGLYLSGRQDEGGAYHTRIAYLAWKGQSGYSLNQIPDF
ncbi:Transmembrane protein 230 [Tetrabaena socialis]|uniref:Transmembrane protein 230 n=1 Tax=Tetrabaena socialis TaxID=47790 RepID=A0A2J7ZU28_9CHLO|nr:Transmembrane protein 230 [Tetrabaena socialis]|eukprot:PNH03769.1 Transmembrane protein 230 [Tetrabaena socialis]